MVVKLSTTSKIVLLSSIVLFPALQLCSQEREASVIREVRHGISAPLRSIQDTPVAESEMDKGEFVDQDKAVAVKSGSRAAHVPSYDSALQSGAALAQSATQGISFPGVSSAGRVVPDTNGAAGRTQYMQWANAQFAVFSKTTGKRLLIGQGNRFWSGFGGPCQTTNPNDGVILYDKLASRWVVSHYAGSGSSYFQCVAISTTTDATGSYYQYAFSLTTKYYPDYYYPDYAKIASWWDAYYLSINMQNPKSGFAPEGGLICALDRQNMLVGNSPRPPQCFPTSAEYMSLLPSDLDGATKPPAGSPNYLLNLGTNSLNLWKFHVNWTTPSLSTLTGPTKIAVATFSEACGEAEFCIPQPGGNSSSLDSLGDRLMHRLAYHNFGSYESIVATHSVNPPTNAWSGIRWYEIRNPGGTPTVYQQGTFSPPDQQSRWMGSIAMDKVGDIAIGYSVSSDFLNPAIRYTGRLVSDPLGTMETEVNVIIGNGVQTTSDRWGDYSGMSVDPVDQCTFWYTNQYVPTNGDDNWATYITSFKFPSCD